MKTPGRVKRNKGNGLPCFLLVCDISGLAMHFKSYLFEANLDRKTVSKSTHNVYVYFLCGLVCTHIHESDAKLICMYFSQTF